MLSKMLLEMSKQIDDPEKEEAGVRHKAIQYLVMLVLYRRPAEEYKDLIAIIDEHTHDMDVKNMAQSIIEINREGGERQAKQEYIIKLLISRFSDVPESFTNEINLIQSFEHLDSIFDKALTAETLDEIGLQNHNS